MLLSLPPVSHSTLSYLHPGVSAVLRVFCFKTFSLLLILSFYPRSFRVLSLFLFLSLATLIHPQRPCSLTIPLRCSSLSLSISLLPTSFKLDRSFLSRGWIRVINWVVMFTVAHACFRRSSSFFSSFLGKRNKYHGETYWKHRAPPWNLHALKRVKPDRGLADRVSRDESDVSDVNCAKDSPSRETSDYANVGCAERAANVDPATFDPENDWSEYARDSAFSIVLSYIIEPM